MSEQNAEEVRHWEHLKHQSLPPPLGKISLCSPNCPQTQEILLHQPNCWDLRCIKPGLVSMVLKDTPPLIGTGIWKDILIPCLVLVLFLCLSLVLTSQTGLSGRLMWRQEKVSLPISRSPPPLLDQIFPPLLVSLPSPT